MTDFSQKIDLTKDIETTYLGKKLILRKPYLYQGPITMQLLPYGGIQSVFHYHLIIYTRNGFIASDQVNYDGLEMSSKDFIDTYDNLVNEVLPN